MTQTISFVYFLEQAKEEIANTSDYTRVCLDALHAKAKGVKSLEVIAKEMEKLCIEKRAYQLAYEASPKPVMDESVLPPLAPIRRINNQWVFGTNRPLMNAIKKAGWTLSTLPDSLCARDKEQIAQFGGLSFADYCALPFVRAPLKQLLFKRLAEASASEQDVVDAKIYQDMDIRNEELRYRVNVGVKALMIDRKEGTPEEREQLRQLAGGRVIAWPEE